MIGLVHIPELEGGVANAVVQSLNLFGLPVLGILAGKRRQIATVVKAAHRDIKHAIPLDDLEHVLAIAGLHELKHVVRTVILSMTDSGVP